MIMDVNKIFGLFNDDSDDPLKDHNLKVIDDLNIQETPIYKIGMFEKMILNIKSSVHNHILDFFKKANEEFDLGEIEETGEYIAYYRAWEYIKDCNIEEDIWKESLFLRDKKYLITALKFAIDYFEEYEDYEKCGFLLSIQTFLENSLASKS
jgi:hypothetical protein